jgi:hypothetical protein
VNDSDFIESVMVVSNWNHRRRKWKIVCIASCFVEVLQFQL